MASGSPQSSEPFIWSSDLVYEYDHGALVTVTAALCIVASSLFYIARLFVRWPWKKLFGRDDWVTGIALFCSLIQSILVSADVPVGLGRTEDASVPPKRTEALKIYYTSELFFVISLCLGRLAVGFLFLRLSSKQKQIRLSLIIMGSCLLYGFITLLLVAIRDPTAMEHGMLSRWIAVSAMGGVLDVAMVIFPFFLVRHLQMERSKKVTVVTGFGLRLPLIALSALRLLSLSHTIQSSKSKYLLSLADTEVWTQIEMHYNIIAASIPCFRIFLRAFHTNQLTHLITDDNTPIFDSGPNIPSNAATKGQSSAPLSDIISAALKGDGAESQENRWGISAFEKAIRGYGKTESSAMRNPNPVARQDSASTVSEMESNEKGGIVVKQTVDVRYADQ